MLSSQKVTSTQYQKPPGSVSVYAMLSVNLPIELGCLNNRDQRAASLLLENKVDSSVSPGFSGISSFDRHSRITKKKGISHGAVIKIIMLICIQVRQKGPETSNTYSPLSLDPLLQMAHLKVSYSSALFHIKSK